MYLIEKTDFDKAMRELAETLGRKLSDAALNGYWEALQKYEKDLVTKAIDHVRDRCDVFPKPKGFIVLIEDLRPQKRRDSDDGRKKEAGPHEKKVLIKLLGEYRDALDKENDKFFNDYRIHELLREAKAAEVLDDNPVREKAGVHYMRDYQDEFRY